MRQSTKYKGRNNYLKRLPAAYYQGQAYVHWTMTIEDRKTGWLSRAFYYEFKEILIHTLFRYAMCSPVYCCMPDHIHIMLMGIETGSDQKKAMKYFRKHLNVLLKPFNVKLQKQGYDHALRNDERIEPKFIKVVDYIIKIPERAILSFQVAEFDRIQTGKLRSSKSCSIYLIRIGI
ncbi:MAG: hypothetical protein DWQ10_01360 [Calditrichaeota bacterium]|nr:MAG: hypothetical protein DWQ10_01360 [Calditrichota bacterium]